MPPTSAWRAVMVLRKHAMPVDEIRAVVSTEDPEIVRRYLELHRERLEERLAEQRRALASVEQVLTRATMERRILPTCHGVMLRSRR